MGNRVGIDQMDFVKTVILFIWKVGFKRRRGLMDWEMLFQEYEINKELVIVKFYIWGGRIWSFDNFSQVVISIRILGFLLGQLIAYCVGKRVKGTGKVFLFGGFESKMFYQLETWFKRQGVEVFILYCGFGQRLYLYVIIWVIFYLESNGIGDKIG